MRPVDLDALAAVAKQLDQLRVSYAFTGGVAVGFLLDHPHLATLRPTGDVDAIAAVVTRIQYTALEEQLRQLGFRHLDPDINQHCTFSFPNPRGASAP